MRNSITSKTEIIHLLKAIIGVSLAFAIAIEGISSFFSAKFWTMFLISAATVGAGFLAHELMHKALAQHYGCIAEFRSSTLPLLFGIVLSITGFIFLAPGAVMIHGQIDRKQYGKISAAGIVANLVIAGIFLAVSVFSPIPGIKGIAAYGAYINSLLAAFNLLPLGNFDGLKVLGWSKLAYGALCVAAVIMVFFGQLPL